MTKNGKFERFEPGEMPRPQTHLTGTWTHLQVIDHLWADDSFSAFAQLLELTDPALDAQASWQRMRQMLDGLDNSDRGNLVELWYQARYAKGAEHRVAANVLRTGDKAGQIEAREIDLVEGNRAIEVKDVGGPIDKDQFKAYLDMAENETEVIGAEGATAIKKVRYVFTRPEGARANLNFLASELKKERVATRLSIEVFDMAGAKHTITTSEEARSLLTELGGPL